MARRHFLSVAAVALVLGTVPALAARDHQPLLDLGRGHVAIHMPTRSAAIGNRGPDRLALGNGSEHFRMPGGGDLRFRHHRFFGFRHRGNFYDPSFAGIYDYRPSTPSWCELVLAAPWRYPSREVNYCEAIYGG